MSAMKQIPKWRMVIGIAALFISSMCTLGDMVITPIAANLYEVFADAPEALLNFGITGPALVGLPFGLLAGWLCDRFDKKWVMVVGFAIFTFSAIFGAAIENIWYFVITRCLATGVGWGITNTAAFSILADLFSDEKKHSRMVGFYNATMSIMGAILSMAAGMLAASGVWQDAFAIYWIAAPVLILMIIFLPSLKPTPMENAEGKVETAAEVEEEDKGWIGKIIPLTIQVFFFALFFFVMLYMVALYIADAGVGDEAFAGTVASCMTLATMVGSILFEPVFSKMKNTVYMPFMLAIGVMFILMGFVVTPVMTIAGAIVMGFSWAYYFCYFYVRVTQLVPENRAGSATGVVAFSDGLTATLCSYLVTGLMGATGMNCVQLWPIFGVGTLITLAISVVYWMLTRKKSVQQ